MSYLSYSPKLSTALAAAASETDVLHTSDSAENAHEQNVWPTVGRQQCR